jgi:histidinol-phosphatase (PHP family)
MPAPDGYDPDNRMYPEQFAQYRHMVREAAGEASLPVYYGIEADYYPGCEPYLSQWLAQQDFDLVIGSVHYIGNWPFESPEGQKGWESVSTVESWQRYFGLVRELAQSRNYDLLAHPDVPKKYGFRPDDEQATEMALPALDAMADSGMAIEINTSGLRKPAGEIYPTLSILTEARKRGLPISFGSDSHAPEEVGHSFAEAVQLAREAGYVSYVTFVKRRQHPHPLPA